MPTSTRRPTTLPPIRNPRSISWRGFTSPANTDVPTDPQSLTCISCTGRTGSGAGSCFAHAPRKTITATIAPTRAATDNNAARVFIAGPLGCVIGARSEGPTDRAVPQRAQRPLELAGIVDRIDVTRTRDEVVLVRGHLPKPDDQRVAVSQ